MINSPPLLIALSARVIANVCRNTMNKRELHRFLNNTLQKDIAKIVKCFPLSFERFLGDEEIFELGTSTTITGEELNHTFKQRCNEGYAWRQVYTAKCNNFYCATLIRVSLFFHDAINLCWDCRKSRTLSVRMKQRNELKKYFIE